MVRRPLGKLTLEEVVAAIASEALGSPGAGSAAAVAMALAAACLSKAAAITLKHDPENAALLGARISLTDLAANGLTVATGDARAFAEYLNDPGSASLDALLLTENGAQRVRESVMKILNEVAPLIDPSMRGDVAAAVALLEAAGTIVEHIRRDTLAARRKHPS